MCKIMVLTNMSKIKSVYKVVNAINSAIDDERDGFGYAIQSAKGVFGERTLKPDGFRYSMKREVLNFNFLSKTYERFGETAKPTGAGIFHGRTSTNHKSLLNTHPLQKHGWSLIHNGVVTDHGPKYVMQTTNDTEHVLERLATGGIDAMAEHLTGYYAVAAFDPIGQLHVIRDDRAPLYFCRIEDIDSYMIATTKASIAAVCKELNWKASVVEMLADNHYLIWQGNDLVGQTTFKPRGATAYENKYASASLRETPMGYGSVWNEYNDGDGVWNRAEQSVEEREKIQDLSSYTESELKFLDECNYVDGSYTILDYRQNTVSTEAFLAMVIDDQLSCTLIRPDGTLMESVNYSEDTLYNGQIA